MSKSGLAVMLDSAYDKGFADGRSTGHQYMLDIVIFVLHREYGFGAKRMCDFVTTMRKQFEAFYPVFHVSKKNAECDLLRDDLDAVLREALDGAPELPEEKTLDGMRYNFVPFEKRYPHIKEVKYK